MAKKEKEDKMSTEHEAKRKALTAIGDKARSEMGEKLKSEMDAPMKKVSVIAPDKESLEKGLEVAKKLSPKMDEIAKATADATDEHDEEPVDMDDLAEEHMEEEHEPTEESADQEGKELVDMLNDESQIDKVMKMLEEKKKSLKM